MLNLNVLNKRHLKIINEDIKPKTKNSTFEQININSKSNLDSSKNEIFTFDIININIRNQLIYIISLLEGESDAVNVIRN